jgi:hypothetical protein
LCWFSAALIPADYTAKRFQIEPPRPDIRRATVLRLSVVDVLGRMYFGRVEDDL